MLDVWPVFVVGVEIGLIIAVIAFGFVQFYLAPMLKKRGHTATKSGT